MLQRIFLLFSAQKNTQKKTLLFSVFSMRFPGVRNRFLSPGFSAVLTIKTGIFSPYLPGIPHYQTGGSYRRISPAARVAGRSISLWLALPR